MLTLEPWGEWDLQKPAAINFGSKQKQQKLYSDQKTVVASEFPEGEDVKTTLKLGAAGFIMKPYSTN